MLFFLPITDLKLNMV
uniref:Uncharacterized protein n=1 Tax=Anguilla anguilla TaxID=7936 RepID=A0A0E9VRK6_ANGAN